MLGNSINDIYGVEGEITSESGFGYLDIDTTFNKDKITRQINGEVCLDFLEDSQENFVSGYEIHNGISKINNNAVPFIKSEKESILGVCNKEGNVFGTYLHGVFDTGKLAENLINKIRRQKGISCLTNNIDYSRYKLNEYDKLAKLLEENIDMKRAKEIIFGR